VGSRRAVCQDGRIAQRGRLHDFERADFHAQDGIALDTFFVTDAFTGKLATAEQRDEFEKLLTRVLGEEAIDLHKLIIAQRISRPVYQAYTGEQIPTQIAFDNDMSDSRTFIEVETEDRIGLLYTIASTLRTWRWTSPPRAS
jgi:UTP:GlnB (protein PII) uridylyltransferase